MPKVRAYGPFLIRRCTGRMARWLYATGRYKTERLGPGTSYNGPEWTERRSKAGRWESRGSARRWVARLAHWESEGVEVVRIGTEYGPPEDLDPFDRPPADRQRLFGFMRETCPP